MWWERAQPEDSTSSSTTLLSLQVSQCTQSGLYAGISPDVVGAGTAWGFYFFFYNIAKSSLQVSQSTQSGLFGGMSPNVVGAGKAWGFYFFFYNIAKSSLQVSQSTQSGLYPGMSPQCGGSGSLGILLLLLQH